MTDVSHIERGYVDLAGKLNALGGAGGSAGMSESGCAYTLL